MTLTLCLSAMVILASIFVQRISSKLKIPMLLGFILLGMLFGSEGLLSIPFDNFAFAEQICTIALIIVMFYGGFGTNWKRGKKVALPSALLASLGVVMSAGLCGLFCHFVLQIDWIESCLIGSLLSSTDAATVFNILRTQNLALKNRIDSLLEIESGSNDPVAYMLVLICLAFSKGSMSGASILVMLLQQIGFGFLIGFFVFYVGKKILKYIHFDIAGFNAVFIFALAILSYSLAALIGGNGYLACYLTGILLGNTAMPAKKELVHFFDGLTMLMQMFVFFLLGLLSFPSQLVQSLLIAFTIFLFLSIIARPVMVYTLLAPFHFSIRQKALVSFAGLRGVASIVFAIMATLHETTFQHDLYHIVFGVVLFSIAFQGTLLPYVARWLKMNDPKSNVLQIFSDYSEESELRFVQVVLTPESNWVDRTIGSFSLPKNLIIALIKRKEKMIVPEKETELLAGDTLIFAARAFEGADASLREETIDRDDPRIGKPLHTLHGQIPLILCIKRNNDFFLPTRNTVLKANDTFVYHVTK